MTHTRTVRYDVKTICSRLHVADAYETVAANIAARAKRNNVSGTDRARAITDALIQHRRNRNDYAWVMGSH